MNTQSIEKFREALINWYNENKRTLPWRDISCPYKIWVSEIILQQTTVEQGLSYYICFIEKFDTVFKLAAASEHDVLKLWQGLGYYSRARNMHKTAQLLVNKFNGIFPSSYNDLIKLKGIGPYTAAAILSFAYNLPFAVVDGNVMRVISRLFAVEEAVNSTIGVNIIKTQAEKLFDRENPSVFNQAIMEFGALHCKVHQPLCKNCFASDYCMANQKKIQHLLPVKTPKKTSRKRYFIYLVPLIKINNITYTCIRKRPPNDIWHNLYDFILFETSHPITASDFIKSRTYAQFLKINNYSKKQLTLEPFHKTFIHKLTHQTIYAQFILLKSHDLYIPEIALKISLTDIQNYPLPILIDKFIRELTLFEENNK